MYEDKLANQPKIPQNIDTGRIILLQKNEENKEVFNALCFLMIFLFATLESISWHKIHLAKRQHK